MEKLMKRPGWRNQMFSMRLLHIAFVVTSLLLAGYQPGWAERRHDVHDDEIALGAEESEGVIYRIDDDPLGENKRIVVIEESIFTVAPDAVFRTKSGASTDISHFKVGMRVKFYSVDSSLTKIWETSSIEASATLPDAAASSSENGAQPKNKETLRRENGVWKN